MNYYFSKELHKIAMQIDMRDVARAAAVSGIAAGTGYATHEALKRLRGKAFGPKSALLMGLLSGGSAIMANSAIKRYLDERKKSKHSGKNFSDKNILSSNKQHSKRHKRHNSKVSPALLLTNEYGGLSVPSGRGPIYNRDQRDSDGNNNNGFGDDRYGYRGKKTRNYRFKNPL